jgi:hypothetical protein
MIDYTRIKADKVSIIIVRKLLPALHILKHHMRPLLSHPRSIVKVENLRAVHVHIVLFAILH